MAINRSQYDPRSEDERYADALKYIDMLFPSFPDYDDFQLHKIIAASGVESSVWRKMSETQKEMERLLREFNYAETGGFNLQLRLTNHGRNVKLAGGHEAYQSLQQEHEKKSLQRSELEYEQMRLTVEDLRNKFFDYQNEQKQKARSEWWVIISLILSAIAIVISLIK